MDSSKAWRCSVCGYIHRGDQPPECCPVCGSSPSDFEPWKDETPAEQAQAPERWQCLNCNYVHEGVEAPDICPVCGAEKDKFEPVRRPVEQQSAQKLELVIAGGGVAGVSAAETIRKASPDSKITIISSEPELPYYRLNLTRYIAGEITKDSLPIHPKEWYESEKIDLISGVETIGIFPGKHSIMLADGREVPYERLILTTGSHPYVPSLPGTDMEGVFTLRTAKDADMILDIAAKGARCVCIGGGILGIETAGALSARGVSVTMLESHPWLMPRQLNQKAGAMLEKHINRLGVKVEKNAKTKEIAGVGRVTGVSLADGRSIPCEMVLITTGVRPNTVLARKAGLEVNNGIIVDNHLRTSQPHIYAAGDVAEHNGQLYGSWAASQFQGAIAGLNCVGIPTQFGGLPRSNTVKVLGLDLTSIGKFMPEDGSYLVVEEEGPSTYVEFVFRDGKMVGAILLGHAELAAPAKKAIEAGTDFSELLGGNPTCAEIIGHMKQPC